MTDVTYGRVSGRYGTMLSPRTLRQSRGAVNTRKTAHLFAALSLLGLYAVSAGADQPTGTVKLSCSGPSNTYSWTIVLDYDHQKVVSAALGPGYADGTPQTTRWTADEIDWNWVYAGTGRDSWAVLNRNTGVLTGVFNRYHPQQTFQCQKVTEQKF